MSRRPFRKIQTSNKDVQLLQDAVKSTLDPLVLGAFADAHVIKAVAIVAGLNIISHGLGRLPVSWTWGNVQFAEGALGIQSQIFTNSGTFIPPQSGTFYFDGIGGGGAGGSGANGVITSAQSQNGGGGGGGSLLIHSVGPLVINFATSITIGAGGVAAAGANGGAGGDSTVGSIFTAPGAAGGEFGGTPAAGTGAGGGSHVGALGVARIAPSNPSWFDVSFGGWGGSSGGPVGTGGTQGRGGSGQSATASNFGAIAAGGNGGVPGANNTNAGGCGGGGGGGGVGTPGNPVSHAGANGRPGGAGSAAGTGTNGTNGLPASPNSGAGGGGGGAGGNGAVAGGTGGTGGNGGSGFIAISWVSTTPNSLALTLGTAPPGLDLTKFTPIFSNGGPATVDMYFL